ncbi:MAG: phytase [Fimbriimonadales bacterium]|nr:phytase [Fimbriimonadales bacterium]
MRTTQVRPIRQTMPLSDDADDPAIWVHPFKPSQSLIIGTNKARTPRGALGVFDLNGRLLQLVNGLDQPNNVDVAYGFRMQRGRVDIAVATERYAERLRIYRIDPQQRRLIDITDMERARVFAGTTGEQAMPMGIALYQNPRKGTIEAIVSRKAGPENGYLHQYQLVETRPGKVGLRFLRAFGRFSGKNEIEAVAVDHALGYVYYADEGFGIRKYYADATHPHAERELALCDTHFQGEHEGIALYTPPHGEGYLLCVEQLPNNSRLHLYPRTGMQREPIAVVDIGADETDGIDATARSLGTPFEAGLLVAMNSRGRNFWLYSWESLKHAIGRGMERSPLSKNRVAPGTL